MTGWKHLLGITFLVTPLVIIGVASYHLMGLWQTLAVFGLSITVMIMIGLGIELLSD